MPAKKNGNNLKNNSDFVDDTADDPTFKDIDFYPDSDTDDFQNYQNEHNDDNDMEEKEDNDTEYSAKGGETEQNESIDDVDNNSDDDIEDEDDLGDNAAEIDDEDGDITSDDDGSIDTDIDDDDCLYKYADEDDPDNEENIDQIVKNEERITKPFMTKYEKVRLIGDRTKQLSLGAKPLIKNAEHLPPKAVAELELKHSIIPLVVERPLPNNKKEKWLVSELIQ